MTKTAEDEVREMEIIRAAGFHMEEAVDLIIEAAIKDQPIPEASFEIVHNHVGGIDLLIGSAFTFPLEPIARQRLALAIQKEEKKKHGDDWRICVRTVS